MKSIYELKSMLPDYVEPGEYNDDTRHAINEIIGVLHDICELLIENETFDDEV